AVSRSFHSTRSGPLCASGHLRKLGNKDGTYMSDILIGNGTVVTLGTEKRLIEQGAVLVRDNRIAAIDADRLLRQQYPDADYVNADVVEEAGIRACLAYEVSDRDGLAVTADSIRENERFIRSLHAERKQQAEAGMIAASYGLHASFTLSPATLERCAVGGADLGVGFHIHVTEDVSDENDSLARYGMRVVDRLEANHILGPRSIAAHCVHVNGDE